MNNKRNILIIGPPDSGKETVMQDLESLINRGYLRIKAYTYGRVTINNTKNYLFSSTKENSDHLKKYSANGKIRKIRMESSYYWTAQGVLKKLTLK